MTASARTASWTGLLAGAVAHDINNFVQGVSSARTLAAPPGAMSADGDETAALIEDDLDQLRKLGARLRALASAGAPEVTTRLADACADAFAEVDRPLGQLRAETIPAELRVAGTAAALTTAIASLLEHALAASATAAAVSLAVQVHDHDQDPRSADAASSAKPARPSPGRPVIVEIAAPDAADLGEIGKERLDVLLASSLPELRGDARLILAGAIAEAIGGAVYMASDPKTGLVFALHLVAC